MSPFDLGAIRFLLASGGCVAAGLGVWALMLLLRRLPVFQVQRLPWLLGQLAIVAAFLVIVLPHSERLRIVPPIELDTSSAATAAAPDTPAALAQSGAAAPVPPAAAPERSWLRDTARAWLVVYLLGLLHAACQLLRGRRLLHSLAAAGRPLAPHDALPGAREIPRSSRLQIIEVDAPVSPMLFGLIQPRLLLPLHLRSFDPAQQQMIVAHELTHLQRSDLHWMSAGLALQMLLWFNPFMRVLRQQLSWAQELGCDRDVLAGRTPAQRKAYAAALIAQMKAPRRSLHPALAFGGVCANTVAQRIGLIRQPAPVERRAWTRIAPLAGLALVVAASLALQPAFAWRGDAAPVAGSPGDAGQPLSCTVIADAATGALLLEEGRCRERVTPASTFNIPISLMGYDSGILLDERTPALPFKKEYVHWNPGWRATTDPGSWLENSVLWYAQQVTSRLGAQRFGDYVRQFGYGNQDVSGDAGEGNGLTLSWVSSSLAISPVEQVAFLRDMVNGRLPVSPRAVDMTSRIMPTDTLDKGWTVRGKTGTASPVLANGNDDKEHQYGWYVGWGHKDGRTVVFARLLLARRHATEAAGPRVKDDFLRGLPARLDMLR